jgi:hypothetical protein
MELMTVNTDLTKAQADQMATEALEAFADHLQGRAGEPAQEYKDFDFDWSDAPGEEPNVVVEVLKDKGAVTCEGQVFNNSGAEFARVSYESLKDEKARGIIAGYVLALKEGR